MDSARPQPILKLICIRAARSVLRTVGKFHNIFAIPKRPEFPDTVKPNNASPMNSRELFRVELLLDGGHGLAQQMRPAPTMHFDIISSRANPFDVFGKGYLDTRTASHGESSGESVSEAPGASK